jgi:small subunit ribosomal protein S2
VVDYVIPGNDDAIRSIDLISRLLADSIIEGRGEEVVLAEDRPVPPAVEDALFAEEAATEALSEAAREGGVSEDDTTGLADPVESAGEISPEEDPTTSYRGAEDRQEQDSDLGDPVADANTADEPDVPEAGRASSGDAEGVPGGGETILGEPGDGEAGSGIAPSSQAAPEPGGPEEAEASGSSEETPSPDGDTADEEAEENNESEEN